MTNQIKTVLAVSAMLLVNQFSLAGATEDLWTALKTANYPNALTAIKAGADLKSLDPAFGTPLNFASCWADIEVVKALIDGESEVNFIAPFNGQSPLMNAASWSNIDAIKLLLASGADMKIKNKLGQTLLSLGIGSTKLDIVKLLVNAGADPNEKFSVGAVQDMTLMNSLIGAYAPKEKLENIKSIGVNLSKIGVTYSPRLLNAKEGDFTPLQDMTRYLLEKGLDPSQKVDGPWGCILFQSIELGKTGVALALIEGKADITYMGMLMGGKEGEKNLYDATSLMVAAAKGDNAVVQALIAAGADINFVGVQHYGKVSSSTSGSITTTTIYNAYEYNTALSLASGNAHPETAAIIEKAGGKEPKGLPSK